MMITTDYMNVDKMVPFLWWLLLIVWLIWFSLTPPADFSPGGGFLWWIFFYDDYQGWHDWYDFL